MIRAKDINNLLEEWITTKRGKVEILEDPSTWREVMTSLKDVLRDIVVLQGAYPVVRFLYNPETEKIKAWAAYLASHYDVYHNGDEEGYSATGYFDPRNRTAVVFLEGEYDILDLKELPERLQQFLRGLKLVRDHGGW
jgi:hypothetical protein